MSDDDDKTYGPSADVGGSVSRSIPGRISEKVADGIEKATFYFQMWTKR